MYLMRSITSLDLHGPRGVRVVVRVPGQRSQHVASIRGSFHVDPVVQVQLKDAFGDDVQGLQLVHAREAARLIQPGRHGVLTDHEGELAN